jgi:hypothetical protein
MPPLDTITPPPCPNAVDFKNQTTVLVRRKCKGNIFSVHAMQACRGSRDIASHILSLGTTWKLTSRCDCFIPGKEPFTVARKGGWALEPVWALCRTDRQTDRQTDSAGSPASSLLTVPLLGTLCVEPKPTCLSVRPSGCDLVSATEPPVSGF